MAEQRSHPYISGPGNIARFVLQLRKAFPATVTSETVKKLGIAPNNESFVINALNFLGIIDDEGQRQPEAQKIFAHADENFQKEFGELVKAAYTELFDLHPDAWSASDDELTTFFRQSDGTSETIGKRQVGTFKVLAGLAGHGELPASATNAKKKAPARKSPAKKAQPTQETVLPQQNAGGGASSAAVGLTVRIEVNLPADASRQTYDNIFKSIRENLIDD